METAATRFHAFISALCEQDETQKALLQDYLLPGALDEISQLFRTLDFDMGDVLMEQGSEEIDDILVIVEGQGEALAAPSTVDGRSGQQQLVGRLQKLDVVGEIGLVMRTPRTSTVMATTPMLVLAISRDELLVLLEQAPPVANALVRWCAQNAANKLLRTQWMHDEAYPIGMVVKGAPAAEAAALPSPDFALADADRRYMGSSAKTTKLVRERLSKLRCLDWEAADINDEAAKAFGFFRVPSGRAILAEGELGDSLMILSGGIANIRKRDGELVHGWAAGNAKPVHSLLGEMAFLNPGARTGSVLAATSCEVLELKIDAVPNLVEHSPKLAQLLHLAVLKTVCPKLADTSAYRASIEAVSKGDWEQWFVDDDYYTDKVKGMQRG